ncbi:hypothetical protein HanRHA438_Chr10g0466521 [Helianthus annuus]|uniref:Uncharacterized protein n=1 Tax=Helianthus annuus TaxID=4232 RepID=A0A9K3HZV9_HELAN|nr:hypothetical protein HanXRQr2_Chr10g0453701 [Helianthus annuus]KAJ0523011.1 hypothetical protein HanIR_Chr10g0489091 [Helianthus annuus]KAJ0880732.1 hypothetical protein HanRHA438_Chr10g0466521 [Helianthus annuus]KAJ0884785.1 hypothetical protein HanPSC8_Chr10g0437891 [Helianthus annuus]
MASVMKVFEHLKIHLEELKKPPKSFGSKVTRACGFGNVYERCPAHSKGRNRLAI